MSATCPKCGVSVMFVDDLSLTFYIAQDGKNNHLVRYILKGWAVRSTVMTALRVIWFCLLELTMRCIPGYRTGPKQFKPRWERRSARLNYQIKEQRKRWHDDAKR